VAHQHHLAGSGPDHDVLERVQVAVIGEPVIEHRRHAKGGSHDIRGLTRSYLGAADDALRADIRCRKERAQRRRLPAALAAERTHRIRAVPLERIPGVGVAQEVDPDPRVMFPVVSRHARRMPPIVNGR
jgi:hypothetical protein